MNRPELFKRLETAIARRSPIISQHTTSGLTKSSLCRKLKRAGFEGDTQSIMDLYTWRGGTFLSRDVAAEKMGITPREIYHFLEFEMAVGHAGHLRASAKFHPHLADAAGRYLPILWDGSNCWFAVDTQVGSSGRIVHIASQSDRPFREAYPTFDEFLQDLVEANEEDKQMRCFERISSYDLTKRANIGGSRDANRG